MNIIYLLHGNDRKVSTHRRPRAFRPSLKPTLEGLEIRTLLSAPSVMAPVRATAINVLPQLNSIVTLAGTTRNVATSLGNQTVNQVLTLSTPPNLNLADPTSTTTMLVAAPNPEGFGQPVTFTALVRPTTGTGTPTGTVTFTIDGVPQPPSAVTPQASRAAVSQLTTSTLGLGTHTVTAAYSGDAMFSASTALNPVTQVVLAPTTTQLTAQPNPEGFGQPVTFTALVRPTTGTGTPTGTVTFTIDGVPQPPSAVTPQASRAAVSQLTTSTLGLGTHTVTAAYSGDAMFSASTALNPVTQVVLAPTLDPTSTTTMLVAAPNPEGFGQPVTFTALVRPTTGTGTPTGTVTFTIDGVPQPPSAVTPQASRAAVSQLTTSTLGLGTHTVTAAYSGDAMFSASTALNPVTQVVLAPTTTQLTAQPNPEGFGQPVTFTALVRPTTGTGTPTGTVTFTIDGVPQPPSAVTPQASRAAVSQLTTSTLGLGTHTVTAAYSGDAMFSASTALNPVTQVVLAPTLDPTSTTTMLVAAPNPEGFGQPVTFTALVRPTTGTGTPTGTVTFTIDGVPQPPSAVTPQASRAAVSQLTTSTLGLGTHTVTAAYSGDAMFSASTALNPVTQVVLAPTTTQLTAQPNPEGFGQPVTFTALVRPTTGTGTPTGTVTFTIDGVPQPPSAVTPQASRAAVSQLTTSTLGLGTHTVTAAYSGDAMFSASTALNPVTQVVLAPTLDPTSTTTMLVAAPNPEGFGQPVTFTALVRPTTGTGTPTGTVTFTIDGVPQPPVPLRLVNGQDQATLTTSSALNLGTHTITAAYSGDGMFSASTAFNPVTQVVRYRRVARRYSS